jgi:glycosyltransferase involved in cell wall biosynthesis
MQILFVLENYFPKIGGVETLFKKLIDALVAEGHDITVVTNKGWKGKMVSYENGAKIVRVPLINRYLFTFLAVFPVIYYARGKDLIHTTSYNAAVPAFFGAKIMRKKSIITFHEVWGKLWFDLPFMNKIIRYLHYLFEQMLLRFNFDKFIGVSSFTAEQLALNKVPKDKISYIYNGVVYKNRKARIDPNPDRFEITFFGRLGISKGLDLLLDAIELVKHKQGFHFNLIMPKEPAGFYKLIVRLIEQKGIGSSISLLHYLSDEDLEKVLTHTDAVVIPSYSEGFCFAAVESIAMQIPIISSAKGALKEVISGKYLEVEDFTAQAFAECFEKGKQGFWDESEIKYFHLHDTVNQYINLYHQMMKN